MALIAPFKALRPKAGLEKKVAALPYDVLSSAEARIAAADNPYSFLHITKSEIDLPENTDSHGRAVYLKALDNLVIFQDAGILIRETKPCYYIYRLTMQGRSQTGLVCVSAISDYENGVIKKHELTRPEKELDRINHIKTTGAQTGNVFLAYKANKKIKEIVDSWTKNHAPEYDFVAEDGIGHGVWIVDWEDRIKEITAIFDREIPATYIADGHHRAASAAKVNSESGTGKTGFFLTTLFPSDELRIMDYNRVIRDLNGLSAAEFLEKLGRCFKIEKKERPYSPEKLHEFGMYVDGAWYRLTALGNTYKSDPIGILDVSILQENVLDPVLGIKDVRTDARIDFVGGIRGLKALQERVDSGEMKVAFSLYPVSMQQLFDIADSGHIMPPKSTWFEPKLRDGLLTHLIK
jgi:uncharacterized protein (DUF1015 family)